MRLISATGNCRGFTLLEMMLVVLIIGLLAVTVSLALPDSAQQRLDRDAKGLQARIALAMEQAIFRNRDYGLSITPNGYRFFQRDGESWSELDDSSRLNPKPLDEATRLSLQMSGIDVDLQQDADSETPSAPQIYIVSDGQVSPFVVELRHPDAQRRQRIQAGFAGDLQMVEVATQ